MSMASTRDRRIVVVGGSLGGLRVTEAIATGGWEGEIVVVSAETHAPYTRPPLSKTALVTGPDPDALAFKHGLEAGRAQWRFGARAVAADLAGRTVTLADGSTLGYDGLVAATGVRPRQLPAGVDRTGGATHVIRTVEDCRALHGALRSHPRVVVLGAGFIGCEVAATAAGLGCRVTVVALDEAPMLRPLGRAVGDAVRTRHEQEGVEFRLGSAVSSVRTEGRVHIVELDDGTSVAGDVVVQSVGSSPCVEWLAGNGLDLTDGIETDNRMRAGSVPGVVAVGDVARFPNPLFDDVPRRVEHWQMPLDTARRAASTLLGDLAGADTDPAPFTPLPSFWSDQYELRLQSFGAPGLADRIDVLEGDLAEHAAVVGYFRDNRLVGALALGLPRRAVAVRRKLLASLSDPAPMCPSLT
ncbi:NADPH-dependent 2,4-dienoyl-CoA reductase/sulfur reductase-like enzyme [Prauserella sediminis]|uniref:NADPH-dependent 2,4-dienoyl-CoA reductase/sulfur reductase-like enzyme n=1 Tax=Prauserella sediminis TaxID=577680 RepID=A0A839XYQ1_9PSEU|nr:FAD-dependent oxidoreductase [Prauserella sediminis]MBB3665543.1 NADPH-dependent 2,4-dienoyl-CoA reductase/sulfur reductase-like enzyme [Prauserella sediminis]